MLQTCFLATAPSLPIPPISLQDKKFLRSYRSMVSHFGGSKVSRYSCTSPSFSSDSMASRCSSVAIRFSSAVRYSFSPFCTNSKTSAQICRTSLRLKSQGRFFLEPGVLTGQKRLLPVVSRRYPDSALVVPIKIHWRG